MAASVKHKFVSPIGDSTDTSQVRPSNWNDEHEFSGLAQSVNGTAPDEAGNVTINVDGKVKTVNGTSPDLAGNISINVDGMVKTVNGQSPDLAGNISVTFTLPSKYEFLATKSGAQNLTGGTTTKATFGTMAVGNAAYYSTANSRFTAPEAGTYLFTAHCGLTTGETGRLYLYKNGAAVQPRLDDHNDTASGMFSGSMILNLAANDYVEVWIRVDTSASSDTDCSYFQGHRLT
jgi:hypothetical protein